MDLHSKRKIVTVSEYREIPVVVNNLIDTSTGNLILYKEVLENDLIRISRHKDKLVFQAGSLIGLIPINDNITINIVPRVPVLNLEHCLQVANVIPHKISSSTRSYNSHDIFISSLSDEITKNTLEHINLIINSGLHHHYKNTFENSSFPKGKILIDATIKKYVSRGISHIVKTSFYERTKDTDLNRIIKLSLWILAKRCQNNLTNKSPLLLSQIQKILPYFSDVSLISLLEKDKLINKHIYIPDTHHYYADAIQTAKLVIQGRGLAFNNINGDLKFSSFLWRMDDIFETYILKILQKNILSTIFNYQVIDGNKVSAEGGAKPLYDIPSPETKSILAKPDIIINKLDSGYIKVNSLIIDVKYKEKGADRDAINQIITYGVAYNCTNVAVISLAISGANSQLKLLGKIGNINVFHYSFQLSSSNLSDEEIKLASSISTIL